MPAPDLMTAELTHWPHHDGYLSWAALATWWSPIADSLLQVCRLNPYVSSTPFDVPGPGFARNTFLAFLVVYHPMPFDTPIVVTWPANFQRCG
jgi:hypothetical protein